MTRCILILSFAVVAIQGTAVASFCPSGNPGEILCEDFDTYCTAGQYPGGAGTPMGAVCPPGTPKPADGDANLRAVWAQTSYTNESPSSPCGSAALLDNSFVGAGPDYYPASLPFACMYPAENPVGGGDGTTPMPIAQHTFKDWSTGELNLSRLIGNAFSDTRFKAVKGSDDAPLVLTFKINADRAGGIFFNDGFMELGFGPPTDPLNRANTDYIKATHCWTACNKLVNQGPFPVICAVGNPLAIRDHAPANPACPSVINDPPPVHNAIAVGILAAMDQGPCHCNGGNHGGQSDYLAFFDGQLWWVLNNLVPETYEQGGPGDPYPSTGTVTPLDGACMPEVSDGVAGGFVLWGWGGDTGPAHNTVTLTIKKDTVKVELSAIFIAKSSTACPYNRWIITSAMELPLKYKGPFDSIRSGVGPGCELSTTSWTSCAPGKTRGCITNINGRGTFVEFDDISLYGGASWSAEGACCLSPSGGCQEGLLEADCQAQGGTFRGASTSCSAEVCCPTPYADADVDGDVDATDFGVLQTCLTGDTITTSGKCSCFDHNGDSKINAQDVESFIICATGPAIIPDTVPTECMP